MSRATSIMLKGQTYRNHVYSKHIVIDFGKDTSLYNRTVQFISGGISSEEYLLSIKK